MAWENVIIGYKAKKFDVEDIIPVDAVFLYEDREFVRMVGWISNLKPYYKKIHWYNIPIYKKENIKRK